MKKTRKEIEEAWIKESDKYVLSMGQALCGFLRDDYPDLYQVFGKEVYTYDCKNFITRYFIGESDDMAYLCRALTLNMLLDYNPELLKE